MNASAILKPIGHGHGAPPLEFIKTVVSWARSEADSVFEENDFADIYSLMKGALGPYLSLLHRKAVMCEVLRVLPGDESDWRWNEGRDITAGPQKPDEMEAGAFQVSYNSRVLGADLAPFLRARGVNNALDFQARIKGDPEFDLAYTARLLRAPYRRWDGPLNQGWIAEQVSRPAVAEFVTLLA